ncbi:MAG: hypothetical protein IIC64_10850 [SAR324 cluster bacterium]|nr:hypothetical protein [SAR324 cluster bacterium]
MNDFTASSQVADFRLLFRRKRRGLDPKKQIQNAACFILLHLTGNLEPGCNRGFSPERSKHLPFDGLPWYFHAKMGNRHENQGFFRTLSCRP